MKAAVCRAYHVAVTLVRSCGRCGRCRQGVPTLCEGLPPAGQDGVLAGAAGEAIHQGMRTAPTQDTARTVQRMTPGPRR